ncbi:hypothetical protein AB0C90_23555 [Streptomyces sp. NPDC048550]|uniref:hypothetical protein n=1 Tax=unclassified Streptomyces TaxID=2593676 RepID=UPI002252AC4D|nr:MULTISPECIES: hypothetical protein [unclassified Streptomyces]MCX5147157.1 hypothetical protein [Streptomyces sp. NBC_00320]WSN50316.1 hypothetical protein OG299_22845 [Streptomyces sp. NBC_01296]WSW60242.1 hypothetical protein OG513_17575 [Streptomyces sp. NBC_00998]
MSVDSGHERDLAGTASPDELVGMRLNHVPPEPSGGASAPPVYGPFAPGKGGGDFASTPAEKKAAAGTIETELEPHTKKAGDHADDATSAARKGFDGWETAAGLQKLAERWDQQVKNLMSRLAAEKTALRGATGLFVGNDTGLGNQFLTSNSKLNGLSGDPR